MTVITLRPSSTVDNDGVSFNGASAHATVNDNSDSTYLSAFGLGDSIRFALDDITVPAGAIVKAIAARLRCASGSAERLARSSPAASRQLSSERARIWPLP